MRLPGWQFSAYRQNGVTVAESGVPVSPPTTLARFFIEHREGVAALPGRTDSGIIDVNTAIAVVNSSLTDANVTYTLRDTSGIIVSVGHGTIAARNHFACFIDQLKQVAAPDFDLPSGMQFGSLEFIMISLDAAVNAVLSGYDEHGTPIKIAP